ncbi:hypothetical protein VUR80DRAFT_5629 [Thermomyces stellatus]
MGPDRLTEAGVACGFRPFTAARAGRGRMMSAVGVGVDGNAGGVTSFYVRGPRLGYQRMLWRGRCHRLEANLFLRIAAVPSCLCNQGTKTCVVAFKLESTFFVGAARCAPPGGPLEDPWTTPGILAMAPLHYWGAYRAGASFDGWYWPHDS